MEVSRAVTIEKELDHNAAGADDDISSATAILFVELYLVVLSFFILLNAIAVLDEEKVNNSVDSVRSRFKSDDTIIYDTGANEATKTDQESLVAAHYIRARSVILLKQLSFTQEGNVMFHELPVDSFFEEDGTTLKSVAKDYLYDVSLALMDDPNTVSYKAVIRIGSSSYLNHNSLSDGVNQAIIKVGILARELVDNGVPKNSVAIGIGENHPENVRFIFELKSQSS